MSADVGLPEALERAAAELTEFADVIRPANGDPFALLSDLDAAAAERVLGWLLENEPDAGVELGLDWGYESDAGLAPTVALQQATLAKVARKSLRRLLHRLRSGGIEVPHAPHRETVATLPSVEDDLNEAMVTALDPTGARLVYLALTHPGRGARIFMVALDEERGILEFEVYTAPRRDARRFLRDFQQRSNFAGISALPDSVRALIARASAAHPASKPLPKGFTEWRSRLCEVPEGAKTPGALVREELGSDASPDSIARVSTLVEEGEVGPWIPRAEVLDATVTQLRELAESSVIVSGATRREQAQQILDGALLELYAEPSASRAANRFEESAYVLWKTEKLDDARACLGAAELFAGPPADNPVARAALQRLMGSVLESLEKLEKDTSEEKGTDGAPLIIQP
jgi:hypothetical protein